MDAKKSPRADIEKERTTYFLMGFVVVLSSFFVLMEWESSPPEFSDWQQLTPVFVESEFIGNTEAPEVPEEIKTTPEVIEYEDFRVVKDVAPTEEIIADSLNTIEEDEVAAIPQEEPELQEEINDEEPVYTEAEVMPQFPGGSTALARFIYKHIEYPSLALKQRIQGRVWCSFIVNKDGSVSNVRLERGIYIFLDEEAIRVLNLMPPWSPGKKDGEPVRVKAYVPIVFKR